MDEVRLWGPFSWVIINRPTLPPPLKYCQLLQLSVSQCVIFALVNEVFRPKITNNIKMRTMSRFSIIFGDRPRLCCVEREFNHTAYYVMIYFLTLNQPEAQQLQWDGAMLCVISYFAKSLEVIQNGIWICGFDFVFAFHSNCGCIL